MTTSHKSLILFLHTPSCFVYSYHLFMQASFKFCKFSRQESWSEVAIPFSSGSPWPRDQSQISCIAGRFFAIGATKEAPRMREWLAIPFSRGQTDTEIEPRSPALQADSLPSKPPGRPLTMASYSIYCWDFPGCWWLRTCLAMQEKQVWSLVRELRGFPNS